MLWLCPASPRVLTGTDPGSLHHDGQFSPLLSSQLLLRQAGRGCLQTCSLPLASLQLLTPAPKLPWTSLLGTPTAFAPQTCARRTRGSTQEAGRSPPGLWEGGTGGVLQCLWPLHRPETQLVLCSRGRLSSRCEQADSKLLRGSLHPAPRPQSLPWAAHREITGKATAKGHCRPQP